MSKVALCLSGHVRHFFDIDDNIGAYLYVPARKLGDVDVFIHTWSELNSEDCFSVQQGDCAQNSNKLDEESLIKIFTPVSIVVENYEDVKSRFVIDKYYNSDKILLADSYKLTSKVQYCIPMFYKWFECNELKKNHELKNNFKYDYVIKARFDLFFFKEMDFAKLDLNYVYFRYPWQDFLIIGSSDNIDKITSIYPNLRNIINKYECDNLPEQFLEYHMQENGINHGKIKFLGENSCWLYPRKYFHTACGDILMRSNEMDIFYNLFGTFGARTYKT